MARRRAVRKPSIDLEIEYQLCRGPLRHSWDFYTPDAGDRRRTQWGRRVAKLCARCGTSAVTSVNALGHQEPWNYKYPDGYSLPADEQPTREELNRSVLFEYDFADYGEKPVSRRVTKRKPAAAKAAAKKATTKKAVAKRAKPKPRTTRHLRAVS